MFNREELKKLIEEKGVIKNYIDLETQLTPNGFDMTLAEVWRFTERGSLDFSNNERIVPACEQLLPLKEKGSDKFGWFQLEKGVYKVRPNEIFRMPNDLIAVAFVRSSLLRMGACTETAFWEAGFTGKVEFLLNVLNPYGLRLKQNARITQINFIKISETLRGYEGIYKNLA